MLLDPLLVEKRLLLLALLSLDEAALDVLLPAFSLDPPVRVLLRETRVFLSFSLLRVCLSMLNTQNLFCSFICTFYLLHINYASHGNKLCELLHLSQLAMMMMLQLLMPQRHVICICHLHHSEISQLSINTMVNVNYGKAFMHL